MNRRPTCRTAPRSLALVVLGLAALLAAPGGAWAADRKAAELQARKAFTSGEYQKALDIYVDLYDETHHPTYLRNVARCHQNLGHADKAIAGFREYLRKAKNLTPEQQAEVEKYIAEMEELKKKEAAGASAAPATAPPTSSAHASGGQAQAPPAASGSGSPDQKKDAVVLSARPAGDVQPKAAAVDLSARAAPDAKPEPDASSPFYTRAWFWAGVGAVAAGIVATVLLVSADRGPVYGNLGHVNVPPSQP